MTDDISLEECRFDLAGVEINPTTLRVRRANQVERIEPKVMQVLLMLAKQAGEVVTRDALESQVWAGRVVSHDALTNTIAKLRHALGDDPRRPRFIETIPKRGYRLIAQPVPLSTSPASLLSVPPPMFAKAGRLIAVAVLIVAVGFSLRTWFSPSEESQPDISKVSIAILPLTDKSGQEDRYFIDGVTRDIIDELGRQRQLTVVAPSTVFSYRDVSASDRSLGQELGVRFLVRGDIRHAEKETVMNMRMIDTHLGRESWAERFAGDDVQIFDIKKQVVSRILAELQRHYPDDVVAFEQGKVTDSLKAYDEFLRGRRYYGRISSEDNRLAMHHFNQAIALDPQFARAYAALALAWARQAIDGWTEEPEKSLLEAARLANRAAEIEPNLPQVELVRGQVALFFGDHAAAISAAMRATRINPNYADAYGLLAWILHYGGRPRLAEKALQEALSRNPASNASYEQIAGEIQFSTHRYAEAVKSVEAALERNPTHARARLWLAATLILQHRYDDALWQVDELRTMNPNLSSTNLLLAFPHKDAEVVDAFKNALLQLDLPELSQTIIDMAAVEF
jgi:TolB-like protein/DNA-binding winged helix-turn-helix (wHTH) protein/Flp pilus assembly protein TadD